jgi:hypothetical protein
MTSLSEYNVVLFLLNFFFLQSVQVGNMTFGAWDPSVIEIRAVYTSSVPVPMVIYLKNAFKVCA